MLRGILRKKNQTINQANIYLTGYSFWDRLHNFLHKFTWIVLSLHKFNKNQKWKKGHFMPLIGGFYFDSLN